MDVLVSGVWTSIASGSGLAGSSVTRCTDSSRLNQESWPLELGNRLRGMAILTVTGFMDRTVCRTTRTSYKFSRTPLDHEKCENYTPVKNTHYTGSLGPRPPLCNLPFAFTLIHGIGRSAKIKTLFASILLPCILVNAKRKVKTGEVCERGYYTVVLLLLIY